MRLCALALLVALATATFAVENQAYLGIFAETNVQRMAGMPVMRDMPKGLPDMGGMMSGQPLRQLNIRLWSPNLAPKDVSAYLVPPAGLKQGPKLNLDLYRPKPEKVTPATGENDEPTAEDKKFTIKIYWGSSETVQKGQPKIIKFDGMSAEQRAEAKEYAAEAQAKAQDPYYYKPNWTTGYWPTKKQPGKIADDASLVGKFELFSSYTGNIAITAPPEVNFLAPIDLGKLLDKRVPLDKAVVLQWKQIPNLLGMHAMAMGTEGENTLILWFSAEKYADNFMGLNWDYMQMAEVRRLVDEQVMMKGDATKAAIPIGIFKDCGSVMLTMIGYGPGAALGEGQPLPRIQTKTTLTAILGGKDMEGMDEGEGIGDEEAGNDEDTEPVKEQPKKKNPLGGIKLPF